MDIVIEGMLCYAEHKNDFIMVSYLPVVADGLPSKGASNVENISK